MQREDRLPRSWSILTGLSSLKVRDLKQQYPRLQSRALLRRSRGVAGVFGVVLRRAVSRSGCPSARLFGVELRFINRLVSEKRITYVKVGRKVRFRVSVIEAYISANTVSARTSRSRT